MTIDYSRYLELAQQISNLEQEKKALGAAILKRLQEEGSERAVADAGVISLKTRTVWKYSPATKSQIELIQKEAQESGEAKQTSSVYLSTSLR